MDTFNLGQTRLDRFLAANRASTAQAPFEGTRLANLCQQKGLHGAIEARRLVNMKPMSRLINRYHLTAGKAPLNFRLVRSLYISRLATLQEQDVASKRRRLDRRLTQSTIGVG